MNKTEISKYIKEQIGRGVPKLEVLKTLFAQEEKKSKRKFIKREIEKFPTPELEDNSVYKFLKWTILILISFLSVLNLIYAFVDPLALISLLIGILFLIYIYKNSLTAYHWLSVISFLNIFNDIGDLNTEIKNAGELINIIKLSIGIDIILFASSVTIIYIYFRKDNKEWKKYVKENKL